MLIGIKALGGIYGPGIFVPETQRPSARQVVRNRSTPSLTSEVRRPSTSM